MTPSNVTHLSGLHDHGLAAFREAQAVVESHLSPAAAITREFGYAAPSVHPRIVLSRCEWCKGTGRYRSVVRGQWRAFDCTQCAGRGSIVGEI